MATETSDGADAGGVSDTGGSADAGESATDEGIDPYIRSITVTTVATVLGMIAGIVAHFVATAPDDITGVLVLVAAIVLQFPIYQLCGIDTSDFGTKDQLYVGFMTFTLWFVTWGILMTAGV
jgi:hypothetical protein